jgi:hypothetical protein
MERIQTSRNIYIHRYLGIGTYTCIEEMFGDPISSHSFLYQTIFHLQSHPRRPILEPESYFMRANTIYELFQSRLQSEIPKIKSESIYVDSIQQIPYFFCAPSRTNHLKPLKLTYPSDFKFCSY